ncbi:precorrin-3B C(17)-methyltransferase [Archaeoglobus veneficus]|uniref:Precorrin-3B C17-methyltransferase n=1 Tax=Archaeoglobus veneficus (strain DSM 11195 / SNP6) TaxID=693661 RepID=F2KS00_ARCVS|nr:precorrin-3B C(17)-methyltransferase [Archaeoglobus veneficus]AEA46841.1 precorrin-3B C17-methyltransferase [Archaeoglobus veneficus SNP6]
MRSQGKLYVVGIGPGDADFLTIKAVKALQSSDYVIGHRTYVDRIREIVKGEIIESRMGEEVERVRRAVKLAESNVVSLVSGGDPSIYGMASLVAEYVAENGVDIEYEVIPGVTALSAASPLLGSAVSGDHAVVSLSDLLTPWEAIERRLVAALLGDYVIAIYNPSSRKRRGNLVKAMELVKKFRGNVPVGIVKNATRDEEEVYITTPDEIMENPDAVDMHTILFVSNSESKLMGGRFITPRGYSRKYRLREAGRKEMEASGAATSKAIEITRQSYEVVNRYFGDTPEDFIIKRCVIATGDLSVAGILRFHKNAVKTGIEAIKEGRDIIVDVHMVKAGLRAKNVTVAVDYGESNGDDTRTASGFRKLRNKLEGNIVAVGNAPSAALALYDIVKEGIKPALIVATPVGFVNAAESKEMIRQLDVPSITTAGPRGGSTICVAILNGMMSLAKEDETC